MRQRVEIVLWQGVKFRRYPDSKRRTDRIYFTPGKCDRINGIKRLHQEIWSFYHGPVKEGFHIHHRDGHSLNNEPSNLESIPAGEHVASHWTDAGRLRASLHAARIRPLSKAWHRSE